MARRVNPTWANEKRQQLIQVSRGTGEPVNVISAALPVIQCLVTLSVELNVPYKVIQLGGGVRRFTTEVTTCPKCGGTGKC